MKSWTYNPQTDAWVFGTSHDGGGVFLDTPMTKTKKKEVWTGNAVFGDEIHNVGDFNRKGLEMVAVEEEYQEMVARL